MSVLLALLAIAAFLIALLFISFEVVWLGTGRQEWLWHRKVKMPIRQPSPAWEELERAATDPAPSINPIIEATRLQLAIQDSQIAALDGKANFVLGSSSLLTAAITARNTLTPDSGSLAIHGQLTVQVLVEAGFLYLLFLFVCVVFSSWKAYTPRMYKGAVRPKWLADNFLFHSESVTKEQILANLVEVFEANQLLIDGKVAWTIKAIRLLLIQAVWLVLVAAVRWLYS